jgi:hypothetical protein
MLFSLAQVAFARVQSLALLTRDNVETLLVQLMPLYGLSLGVSNCMGTARNID